ncbi:hypothetical protein OOK31_16720 [Streptomyces sp. NBC_00249]|uniref:hypothetical protein n=1 Tax=Streptomyces sp. NBC_00249 TaxID=2975690 RepID=UPI002250DF23|nr:hypothetical protein [Streptomyces sp. NBC_00249]MCX5195529.1 hypothetical protein [Streptomyces sp. NBC_00249]
MSTYTGGGWYPGPPGPPVPYPAEPTRGRKLLRLLLNPLYAAQLAFRPTRPGIVTDPTVRGLQVWRTVLGVAAWLALTLTYSAVSSAGDAGAVAGERLDQSWTSFLVLACTFPLVVGAFAAAARGGMRRVYLRRALRPLGAVAALMTAMATFPLAMAPESQGLRDAVGIPGKIVMGLLCLWSLGFAGYGIGLSLVHVLRTADVHELLPPVLATVLVWEMAVLDLVTGAYGQVPPGVRLVFVLGAPVTVTVLSVWELYRLHRHGLSVRGALSR